MEGWRDGGMEGWPRSLCRKGAVAWEGRAAMGKAREGEIRAFLGCGLPPCAGVGVVENRALRLW